MKHKTDFALWKFSEEPGKRQQEWDSLGGLVFGMAHRVQCDEYENLGEHFDIHTGGEDHITVLIRMRLRKVSVRLERNLLIIGCICVFGK
jgi:hypothetical protein